ncbi:MAG: glycosyltransferase, partial [Propionibacteriaceae bacterium]
MPDRPVPLRDDLTPCILHTALSRRGGGLARAVPERASLYARHFERVVVLTTGFAPRLDVVVAELHQRGTLDERVVVRNFFRDSAWVRDLGEPPGEALGSGGPGVVSQLESLPGSDQAFRVADRHEGQRHPFQYRYFHGDGRPLLTSATSPGKKYELRASRDDDESIDLAWGSVVAQWVDQEIADLRRPVLFSLQRGLVDPVLLATTKASRKVVSLHNCHYRDPEDPASGIRATFRPVLVGPRKVDEVVCLTQQQRRELKVDAPRAVLRTISYPGRVPREAPEPTDDNLVVLVARLEARKRVDHAVRAFALVTRAVPAARLEIYGAGPEEAALRRLVEDLGLAQSVVFKGYSLAVGNAQSRALCTLLTSTFEGFARVISESMSRGTPVVAYSVRYGPRDLIRDQVDGLL